MYSLICGFWEAGPTYSSRGYLKHHHFKLSSSTGPAWGLWSGHCSSWTSRRGWSLQRHPAQGCLDSQGRGSDVAGSSCWQWASHNSWGTGGSAAWLPGKGQPRQPGSALGWESFHLKQCNSVSRQMPISPSYCMAVPCWAQGLAVSQHRYVHHTAHLNSWEHYILLENNFIYSRA